MNKKIILVTVFTVITVVSTAFYSMSNTTRWMIWNEDHYEEADFSKQKLADGILKMYKEERIENFKKIKDPNCNYAYFTNDRKVNSWYGKNKEGKHEIFTDIGLHPETGKSLKPITIYMIRKYFCDTY